MSVKSFVVELWSKVFCILGWISPYQVICQFVPVSKSYGFVDVWVLGHLLLSVVLLLICRASNLRWLETIAVYYGAIRVFEVLIYQINVLLFADVVRSFRRIVILLLHNYVEIIFWFALFYRNIDWAFETGGVALDSFFAPLKFSFVTMTTFGYTAISPKETLGDLLVIIQSAIGLFMTLLILARFISLLPSPETRDESEK